MNVHETLIDAVHFQAFNPGSIIERKVVEQPEREDQRIAQFILSACFQFERFAQLLFDCAHQIVAIVFAEKPSGKRLRVQAFSFGAPAGTCQSCRMAQIGLKEMTVLLDW